MRTKEQIEQLKRISIAQYLSEQGLQPIRTKGAELIYYSPKNNEHTPSFCVNPQKNVFHDFSGEGEQGDIIRLVQYLTGRSFMQAVEMLEAFEPKERQPFFLSGQNLSSNRPSSAIDIISTQPLQSRTLIDYVTSRKISPTIASNYLQEVHYRIGQKHYYAAGFGNDKGGFELRSRYFKGGTSPKWFTYLPAKGPTAINLFEGVFDFLSCCQYFNVCQLKNPTVILNSLSFLDNALSVLSEFALINAFLDNDDSGRRALERLKKQDLNVQDCSHYYLGNKDFNDYLMINY